MIEQGRRLSKPEKCPDDIYRLMLDCWNGRDRLRPNFQFLAKFFTNQHLSHVSAANNANMPDENCNNNNNNNEEEEKLDSTFYV